MVPHLWFGADSNIYFWLFLAGAMAVLVVLTLVLAGVPLMFWKRQGPKNNSSLLLKETAKADSNPAGAEAALQNSAGLQPGIDEALRNTILSTWTIVQDLQNSAQDSKLRQAEEENQELKEKNSDLRQQLDDATDQLSRANGNLSVAIAQRDRLRKLCIFIKGDAKPLDEFIRNLAAVEESCEGICRTISKLSEEIPYLKANYLHEYLAWPMLPWLRERHRELTAFAEEKISAVPGIVGPHAGKEISADDFTAEIEGRFFDEFVRPIYGKLLGQLQRFYGLPKWTALSEPGLHLHGQAVAQLKQMEQKAAAALKMIGIEPLTLNFFEPCSKELNSYIQVRSAHRSDYYSEWHGELLQSSAVLEVERWAYLDRKNVLRNGEKASVIVVGV
jgi:hypothetical protein